MKSINQPILWIDLEMTGLDVKTEKIIEFACFLTGINSFLFIRW